MAEPIKNIGKSPVPTATRELPVLERQVTPEASTSTPNFTAAFDSAALSPTALGEVSSAVTNYAANTYAERQGRMLGKNPEGELLPPLTKADKTFVDAYSQQAKATLGLQAQGLINKSKEEVDSGLRLSPEKINDFAASTLKGLDGILSNAPSTIRTEMEYQYQAQVQSDIHNLNEKMISQQKQYAASEAQAWRTEQSIKMTEAARDGALTSDGKPLSAALFESINQNIQAAKQSGQMSPVEASTALISNKLNYNTALETKKAYDAQAKGGAALYEYLNDISTKKIGNLSWAESESVRDNVVRNIGAAESASNRYQTYLGAEALNEIQLGTFTSDRQAYYKGVMRPEKFLQAMTTYYSKLAKGQNNESKVAYIVGNAQNPTAYAGMKAQTINDAFDALTNSAIKDAANEGKPISVDEAKFKTASYMAVPIPKYLDEIHLQLSSTSPNQIMTGYENYEKLHLQNGFKTIGIKPADIAKGEIFRALLSQEKDPQSAAEMAQEIVYNKDESIIKQNEAKIAQEMKGIKPDGITDWATKISGVQPGVKFDNAAAFGSDIHQVWMGYMQLTNGDTVVSQKLTQQYANKAYDVTRLDGEAKISYLPIEKTLGMEEGGTPLIQEDIMNSVEKLFAKGKKVFDSGHAPSYWRVVPRYSYNDYMQAKNTVHEKGYEDPEYAHHKEIMRQFEEARPIEIEQVTRGKEGSPVRYNLSVNTPYTASVSPSTGEVLGGYNLTIKDPETGMQHALYGYYGAQQTTPTYQPNKEWLSQRYINVIPAPGLWKRAKELPIKALKAIYDAAVPEAH